MSNPLKKLKKNFKKILTVAVVVGAIYLAWPAITGAMSGSGAAAAGSAATTAGTAAAGGVAEAGMGAAIAGSSGAAAAGTTAAAGSGLVGAVTAGAAKVGSAIAGASPLVKMGLIQTGGAMLQGAMTPKPKTAAEEQAELLQLYQSQPTHVQTYSTGQAGLVGGQAGYGYQNQFSAPQASTDGQNVPAPVARLNQETGVWERAS